MARVGTTLLLAQLHRKTGLATLATLNAHHALATPEQLLEVVMCD